MKPKVFSIKSKEDRVREEAQCGSLNLMNSESSLKDQTKGLTLDGDDLVRATSLWQWGWNGGSSGRWAKDLVRVTRERNAKTIGVLQRELRLWRELARDKGQGFEVGDVVLQRERETGGPYRVHVGRITGGGSGYRVVTRV
ncbi:hypothetical protein U1Q18_043765 [Sarracenia purpurea var. burkii]